MSRIAPWMLLGALGCERPPAVATAPATTATEGAMAPHAGRAAPVSAPPSPRPHSGPIPEAARQLLLVTSDDWGASRGSLERFERDGTGWKQVGDTLPVVLGRAGLGWGTGLHPAGRPGPVKREGDGRSPAGVFALGPAWGYAASLDTEIAYTGLVDSWRCVDDPESQFYGRVLDAADVEPDWHSAEHMRRADDLYRLVVFVAHNAAPPRAGAGSCIFLHVWSKPDSTTSGCFALPSPTMDTLLGWLRPGAVLVALPRAERRALKKGWSLPE